MSITITVPLGARSYPIHIGTGLIGEAAQHLRPYLASARVILISDDTVAAQYAQPLVNSLVRDGIRVDSVSVAPGEHAKQFSVLESLCERILALTPDRKTTILALGGGVVGDLAGFAASILLRGMPFIQIPTTLLAQVDSSVGGKTAINSRAGKNLIGSFYQPQAVLIDTNTLTTLPLRERRAGYAEIIKYGLIADATFYRWCVSHGAQLLAGDEVALHHAIATSCRMKAEIVAADERESGNRALLNFGHTFAHALEAETGMSDLLYHGEAVAVGMVMASRLSAQMGLIDAAIEQDLATHLRVLGLAAAPSDIAHPWQVENITRHFAADKKAEDGALTFVVLAALGKAQVAKAVDPLLARRVVASFL